MSDKKKLTKEEVIHLAKLSRMHVDEKELEIYAEQLGETVDFIDNINDINTDDVKPTYHSVNAKNVSFKDGIKADRTLSQEDALKNSQNVKDSKFVVKKILDK
jgi:aspartyl-tRNA(Asn)/glutamyl-tRNA(Gln) amidotransferase subunit C